MAIQLSRRTLLRSGALTLGMVAVSTRAERTLGRISTRPYTWEDACARSDVDTLAISPDGATLAIQITRPLSAPGVHAGQFRFEIQPRAEIWLLDEELGHPLRLDLGVLWAWAPRFSPQGSRLAALVSQGDGRVGIVTWDLSSRTAKTYLDLNVALQVCFSCDGVNQRILRGFQFPMQFAWLDEDSLLFVDHGDQVQFAEALAMPGASRASSALRERAFHGEQSVRIWGESAPTCGSQRSIAMLDCRTGHVETFYRSDVRGVAVAPDHSSLAVVVATSHIRVDSDRQMEPGLGAGTVDNDPLVSLAVAHIDLKGAAAAVVVDGPHGVGNVTPTRLPVWSVDCEHFAVPMRETYSSAFSTEGDACWNIQVSSAKATRWAASSVLDSELVAAIVATAPPAEAKEWVDRRPSLLGQPGRTLAVGENYGCAFRYSRSGVAVWSPPTLMLLGKDGVTKTVRDYDAIHPPVPAHNCVRMFATNPGGTGYTIRLNEFSVNIDEFSFPSDWMYLGLRAQDGAVLAKQDADTGTSLFGIRAGGRRRFSSLRLNEYFRQVARPARREVRNQSPLARGHTGVLQLPVGRSPSDRHPVILWAYPDFVPTLNDSLTKVNDWYATWLPFQYLLTRGFAVFHAPLETRGESFNEPLDAVAAALLPWLDILNEQPEILSGEFGFYGHSDAGYVALALEATTSQFKAIVASSTFPDLGPGALSSSLNDILAECTGQLIQANRFYYENSRQRYGLGTPFWRNEERFRRNSPLLRMGDAVTPILLIEGEFDYQPRQMESLFSILYGRGVSTELAYYWGEGHVLGSPGNLKDMWSRTERFFRTHLRMR